MDGPAVGVTKRPVSILVSGARALVWACVLDLGIEDAREVRSDRRMLVKAELGKDG